LVWFGLSHPEIAIEIETSKPESPNTEYVNEFEQTLESNLRRALGEEGFERGYAIGAGLSVSSATELALERSRPTTHENGPVAS
jgi:hypothetical protein